MPTSSVFRPAPAAVPRADRHVPALDGVRGVAILLVLATHLFGAALGPPPLLVGLWHFVRFGWIGVDLFFVLSGFLITGILLDAPRTAAAWRSFLTRRARRIWPLYLLVVGLMTVLAFTVPPTWPAVLSADAPALRGVLGWYWTHTVNLWLVVTPEARSASPYGGYGLWSLALEEQFYLVWPLAALGRAPRTVARIAVALFVGSVAVRVVGSLTGASPEALYVFPLARLDGLALGAWLACAARIPAWWARVAAWTRPVAASPVRVVLGLCALYVVVRLVLPVIGTPMALGQAVVLPLIVAWAGVFVAAATAHPGAPLAAVCSGRALRYVGRISYGLYAWHVGTPLIAFVVWLAPRVVPPLAGPPLGARLVAAVVLWAVADVSWRWWESRWLRRRAPERSAERLASERAIPTTAPKPDAA